MAGGGSVEDGVLDSGSGGGCSGAFSIGSGARGQGLKRDKK